MYECNNVKTLPHASFSVLYSINMLYMPIMSPKSTRHSAVLVYSQQHFLKTNGHIANVNMNVKSMLAIHFI